MARSRLVRIAELWPQGVRDRRGSILPLMAAGVAMFVGMSGLAVDASHLYVAQNRLQTTADAAAMAGARELYDPALAAEVAAKVAGANMPRDQYGDVLQAVDIAVGSWNASTAAFTTPAAVPNAIRVVTRRANANDNAENLFFAKAFGFDAANLEADAIAMLKPGLPLCLLALHPTQMNALEVTGSGELTAADCLVHSNSSHADSIHVHGGASLTAKSVCAVGGVRHSFNITPEPQTGCPELPDPLADLPTPSTSTSCGGHHTPYSTSGTNVTLNPGVYCGGISISSGASVTFNPGTYLLVGGPLKVASNTTVSGTDVFVHFRGNGAVLDLQGGSTINFSAPRDGDYAGIVFYADRSQSGQTHFITGNASMFIDGTMYIPTGHVEYTGRSNAAITMLIARTIKFNGNSGFQRYSTKTSVPVPSGYASIGAEDKVFLVQ